MSLVPGTQQAWAVGYWERSPGDERPLAYHWTGSGWYFSPVPNAGLGAYLYDVVAVSQRNVWAVGSYYASKYDHRPYAAHWNGVRWTRVTAPAVHGGLRGVSVAPGGTLWAVGYQVTSLGGEKVDKTLIVRWTGRAWKPVASPGLSYSLSDIAMVSARDGWAVGDNDTTTIALRWNGQAWHRVTTPNPANPTLDAIAAVRGAAYAAGSHARTFYAPTRTLMLRWSAARGWRPLTVPSPGYAAELHGVAATSTRNVWAVGEYQAPSGDQRPLALHWNGQRWNAVEPPGPTGHVQVNGVASSAPTRVFAVGYNHFDYDPSYYAYLTVFNGTTWRWWES